MTLFDEIQDLWGDLQAHEIPEDEALRAIVRHVAAVVREWAPGPEAFPIVSRSYNDVAERLLREVNTSTENPACLAP